MASHDLSWLIGELRTLAGDLNGSATQASPLVVAIDQGGHASRAMAFDLRGRLIAESFAPISTFRSGADRVEHDPVEVSESIRTALGDLHQSLGEEAHRVIATGLATQRSSIACWDQRSHKAIGPILSWQDRRNASLIEQLRANEAGVREQTGLVLSAHYGASKIRWCLEQHPQVREAQTKRSLAAGPLASWLLRSHLHERPHLVDAVNAAHTQLLDISSCEWSAPMLALFGVPGNILPTLVANRHAYGHIAFGDRRVPLVVCTGDQSAMPFAHGRPNAETIYLNIGTGAFMQRVSSSASVPEGLLKSVLWLDPGGYAQYSIEGTVNGAGSAIDWLNERIGIDTHRAALSMTRAQAENAWPPLFMNGICGVGSPYWRSQFEPRFIGEGNETERLIAVLESIAFLVSVNIERMREGAMRILASGGLSMSDYLCECVASLSGIPLERTSLQESTATGLAYLIAGEPQQWQPEAKLERFAPDANRALAERYARWRVEMEKQE